MPFQQVRVLALTGGAGMTGSEGSQEARDSESFESPPICFHRILGPDLGITDLPLLDVESSLSWSLASAASSLQEMRALLFATKEASGFHTWLPIAR